MLAVVAAAAAAAKTAAAAAKTAAVAAAVAAAAVAGDEGRRDGGRHRRPCRYLGLDLETGSSEPALQCAARADLAAGRQAWPTQLPAQS